MKLIIQIPCYNEEKSLPITLRDLPKKINGVDAIEVLVINDGSKDRTSAVARENGVNHILELSERGGLARAFKSGLERSLELGADIIVNTDADNQYPGRYIEELIRPILDRRYEIVVGCREMSSIKEFSFIKKVLQAFGSSIVRKFSGAKIPDTTSGFRAYSRDAAMKMNIFSSYTYTLETIIQAGRQNIPMTHIMITTNNKLRESRLIKNMGSYIARSAATILRIYLMYEPLKTFSVIGFLFSIPGVALIARFLYLYSITGRSGHIQSLIIAAIFIILGCGITLLGLLGDIMSANRRLDEEILYRLKKNKC